MPTYINALLILHRKIPRNEAVKYENENDGKEAKKAHTQTQHLHIIRRSKIISSDGMNIVPSNF